MSQLPAAGVDAQLERLLIAQRVAKEQAQLDHAIGRLRARARRAGALARVVRERPTLALALAFAAGVVAGVARGGHRP